MQNESGIRPRMRPLIGMALSVRRCNAQSAIFYVVQGLEKAIGYLSFEHRKNPFRL